MKTHIKRIIIQICFFILQNPFLKNFAGGRIYQGDLKVICAPGLNCYSCPAAAVSCPVGALQNSLASARNSAFLYVSGFLLTAGAVFGRFICGYVCPMGLLQDLLYRIKTKKLIARLAYLRYVKYAVLALFVIILPIIAVNPISGTGSPWFCKYICPSGTIFGAAPLLAANGFLRDQAGAQFVWKAAVAVCIVVCSVFVFRVFCRVLCPLGALYALFNRIALVRMRCDREKCVACGACSKACHIKIEPVKQPNAPECVRCGKCRDACGRKALTYTFGLKQDN